MILLVVVAASGIVSWELNDDPRGSRPDLIFARLDGGSLTASHMRGVNLTGAHLRQVDLSKADLRGGILDGVQAVDTVFSRACLMGTRWRKASLVGVNFEGADLRGADLSEVADLVVTSTSGAVVDRTTRLPPGTAWRDVVGSPRAGPVCK